MFHTAGACFTLFIIIYGVVLPGTISHPRHATLSRTRPFTSGKIVGGTEITIDQVPWQVALEINGTLKCGGSILSPNFILTAAHCTYGHPVDSIKIRSGTSTYQSGGVLSSVATVYQNPNYLDADVDYDISVIKLAAPIKFGGRQLPVFLAAQEPTGGDPAKVTGWGVLEEGSTDHPVNLQALNVEIVPWEACNATYGDGPYFVTERMICAGKAVCGGDSGGPIIVDQHIQAGVVNWGHGCGDPNFPDVYASVAAYRQFITESSNGEALWL